MVVVGRIGQIMVALWVIYEGILPFAPALGAIGIIASIVAVVGGILWIANK